ncbi:MAG: IPT/TIG domain-containing protein [Myxococcaceae bacterium]
MQVPFTIAPLALVALTLVACPGPTPDGTPDGGTDGGGGGEPPSIIAINPTEGPIEGGTTVLISGDRFLPGARVFFGGAEVDPADVNVPSTRRISAKTPPVGAPGSVSVKVVNPDGLAATLLGAFIYRGATSGIGEAKLLGEPLVVDSSGTAALLHTVRADVEVPGITGGDGAGLGVKAQIGWAEHSPSLDLSAFQWVDAAWESDVDGPTEGDRARDRYQGQLSLPGAAGGEVKVYVVAARFTVDGGQKWVVADFDGSSNGAELTQLQRVELSRNTIDWCKLGGQSNEAPPSVNLEEGDTGPAIYAQLYEAGVTDAANAGSGIAAELGYGPRDSDPAAGGWAWTPATFNVDTGNGSNDEYQAVLPNPGAGSYSFVYRVQVGGGAWRYCDANGTGADSQFEIAQAGKLTVTSISTVPACKLLRVTTPGSVSPLTSVASGAAVEVQGRVVLPGVTDRAGPAAGLLAQVGVGSLGVNASTGPNWGWKTATYQSDESFTGGELFAAAFAPAYIGNRSVSFRYSTNNGQSWTYCDLDGSQNGYSQAQQAPLTVGNTDDINYCKLQWPPTLTRAVNATTPTLLYGQVFEAGITGTAGVDPAVALDAEWGWGRKNEDPGLGWTWAPAQFNAAATGGNNEFMANLTGVPEGSWSYTFRFRRSGNHAWCYGDLDGNGADPGLNGFTEKQGDGSENLGQATITP